MHHHPNKFTYRLAVLLFLFTVFFLLPSHNARAFDAGWESLTVPTQAGVISVRAIRINLGDASLQIRSLTDVSGERMDVAGPVKSLKSFVDEVGGFAGINGSYFCPSDYAACAGKAGSFHWMWYDSVAGTYANPYQNQFNPGPVVAFDTQNRMHFFKNAEDWPGQTSFESRNNTKLQALISNGPGLMYEGQLTVSPDQLDAKQRDTKSNRSGLGIKNNMLYLVVASSSTVMDLGYAMQAMGMQYAVNLDGGGSSALYYNGQYGVGPGRDMPNALVFADAGSRQTYTPPPAAAGSSFFAYDTSIRGGFTVASGNVTGDTRDEIVTGTASGLAPQIRVFDNQGNLKSQFFAYDTGLRNGVHLTTCDVNGDGMDEIVTAQGKGGWPLVKIFSGDGTIITNGFYVLDGKFSGGVNLSCGDIDGNGVSDIVVAAGPGGGPHVLVYDAQGTILTNFMAYDKSFRGGIEVATADADGDGRDEIITGPTVGASHVQIFQIHQGSIKRLSPGFFAFNSDYRGGVSVAGLDTDGDGIKEIVIGVGDDATPLVKVYNIHERLQSQQYVFAANFLGGLQLAGGDVDGDGIAELLAMPRGRGGPQVRIVDF